MSDESTTSLPPVVDAAWVAECARSVAIADVRWYLDGRSGHDAYLDGHIPGAVWVHLDTVLSAPPSTLGGRHPLPEPAAFAQRVGKLGLGDDDLVIAYDDQGGGFAARLVWLLRQLGQPAALLDGGLSAWPGPLDLTPVTRTPRDRLVRPWPRPALRTANDVQEAATSTRALVLDARAAERYSGAARLPGETRVGHVPGAMSAPWTANLGSDGRFLAPAELRRRFEQLGVGTAADTIVYCGSGVTACHDLLAIEHAGLPPAALYPGSWSAWSVDQSRPVVAGPSPLGLDEHRPIPPESENMR
jgi:thiosulfate/3-mercaptopyruvate sulfurtransferase